MEMKIPLADLDYGPEEEKAVMDVMVSRWLTMGAVTQKFEQEFAEFLNVKYAFAVSNGTVALHLANMALGVGTGDQVILPALTFVATANASLYTGAEVIFAEIIGNHDLNVSPEDIKKRITPKTKAITVVHYGGYACRDQADAREHEQFVLPEPWQDLLDCYCCAASCLGYCV